MSQIRRLLRWLWNMCVGAVVACCLWGLVRDTRELTPLKLEAARLEKLVGRVEVRDESQVHVLAIKSDHLDELSWRVILPVGHTWNLSHQIAGGATRCTHCSDEASARNVWPSSIGLRRSENRSSRKWATKTQRFQSLLAPRCIGLR